MVTVLSKHRFYSDLMGCAQSSSTTQLLPLFHSLWISSASINPLWSPLPPSITLCPCWLFLFHWHNLIPVGPYNPCWTTLTPGNQCQTLSLLFKQSHSSHLLEPITSPSSTPWRPNTGVPTGDQMFWVGLGFISKLGTISTLFHRKLKLVKKMYTKNTNEDQINKFMFVSSDVTAYSCHDSWKDGEVKAITKKSFSIVSYTSQNTR